MGLLQRITGGNPRKAVVRYAGPGADQVDGPIMVRGREVVLHRPELIIDKDGSTLPGVDRQLACNYLVANLSLMLNERAAGASVEFVGAVGRFATARYTLPSWGVSLDVCQPVNLVTNDVARVFTDYHQGLAGKVREMRKGTQRFDAANTRITAALARWQRLRDADKAHVNDPEWLYVKTALVNALVLNALVPVPIDEGAALLDRGQEVGDG